uniref:Uncharacterized protein At2g10070/F7B19.21 n=2 Tax=Arabidopsis thaliana TaxID=3702 RepID=Q84RI6_ARATH|nr:hypothetical protein [Arabidopsis thaliana]AAV63871.1 hypothetical protein At2g10070 [Arabidopsis thaliana]
MGKRINPLPPQYNFTPADNNPPPQSSQERVRVQPQQARSFTPRVSDYPPPQALFQNSSNREVPVPLLSEEVQNEASNRPIPQQDPSSSPLQNSHASYPSSQGNNFHEPVADVLPELREDSLRALNDVLQVPGREAWTTVLSPTLMPKTTWFTRDTNSSLVRKTTKVWTNKFDGLFYSWSCVPQDRREKYFLEFVVQFNGILKKSVNEG